MTIIVRVVVGAILMVSLANTAAAGPVMDAVKEKIYYALLSDEDRWMFTEFLGDVQVDGASEEGSTLYVNGSFKYENAMGIVSRRYYSAKLKVVLDDVSLVSLCWPYEKGTWCAK